MATNTTNFGLVKPAQSDFYDITVHNGNMDKIDKELKNVNDAVSNAKATADNAVPKTTSVTKAGTNLNDYNSDGVYYFPAEYSPVNVPTGTDGWLLVFNRTNITKQLWIRQGTVNSTHHEMFIRGKNASGEWADWVQLMTAKGGTFTGAITLNGDPTANLHPATKQYVDAVKTTANNAQTTANTAVENAANAQTTANTAVENAANAQTTANTAVENAANAQTTANNAVPKTTNITSGGTNLNDYNSDGVYYFPAEYSPVNVPAGNTDGWLLVFNRTNITKQLWIRQGTVNSTHHEMFIRGKNASGEWADWVQLMTAKGGDVNGMMRYAGGASSVVQAAQYCFRNIYVATADDTAATTGSIKMWRK